MMAFDNSDGQARGTESAPDHSASEPGLNRLLARPLSRRRLLAATVALGLGLEACRSAPRPGRASTSDPALMTDEQRRALESRFQDIVAEYALPGCAAAIVKDARLAWSAGFGMADLDAGTPMTPDTLLNIGSVTKTVTATAVLQLAEQGRLDLDADVGTTVSFPVRNPRYPNRAITARQLLTHRSSVRDSAAYGESYRCGDQTLPLGEWLSQYFTGADLSSHFHIWEPGDLHAPTTPRPYSNVAFGLLGHLVERVSGSSYEDYCRDHIFGPLGMSSSGFRLDRIDQARHATPYGRVPDEITAGVRSIMERLGRDPITERPPTPGSTFPFCLYSFATPPDGLLRTSANELARFIGAWSAGGSGYTASGQAARILHRETVDTALAPDHFMRMLCWDLFEVPAGQAPLGGEAIVYHDGGDPGISTFAGFRRGQRTGMVLLFNTSSVGDGYMAGVRELAKACNAAMG